MNPIYLRRLTVLSLALTLAACNSASDNTGTELIDTDGDGVVDSLDAFPNDATETTDTDGDGTGDNSDVFPNNTSETNDSDNDGTGDNADVFPNDATETTDSDNDGTGDNADDFPNDATETTDSDNDGTGDNADAFPNDTTETTDSDNDGTGDNADAFPNDATETTDSDNDGTGDNADVDADNDSLIELYTLEQLDWVRNDLAGTSLTNHGGDSDSTGCPIAGCEGYELMANLDFDTDGDGLMNTNDTYYDYDGDNSDNGWLPIGDGTTAFSASFNGNNFSISNLYINRPSGDAETSGLHIGFFGYVFADAEQSITLNNINLDGPLMAITGGSFTAGLIGLTQNTNTLTVRNNIISGDIYGANGVGGLIGFAENNGTQTLSNNTINSHISSDRVVGGLVGRLTNDSILIVNNTLITGDVSGGVKTGGLIGLLNTDDGSATLSNNLVSSAVSGSGEVGVFIGTTDNIDDEDHLTYTANHYNTSKTGIDTLSPVGNGVDPGSEVAGFTLTELQCPIMSDNADDCVTASTLYDGWNSLDWDFGTSTELPGLVIDGFIYRDANGDGNLTITEIPE